MNFREAVGLALAIIGAALVPVSWMLSRELWVVAGIAFFIGVLLFFTKRISARAEELEKEEGGGSTSRYRVPKDLHNYSGWRTGGRSETMDGDDE